MKYTKLGRAGARVSRIALGTMNMGPVIGEEESFEILDAAFEAGVNFFDTADVYGGRPWGDEPGQTEELVGRWLSSRGHRDEIVLATKVYGRMGAGVNDEGLSSLNIRRAVEASLRRLQTDRIDLYQMHHIDKGVHVDEVQDAFSRLADQGKIVYVGSSNFAGWNIAQYQENAVAGRRQPLVTEQSVYSLAKRTVELEVAPAAAEYGMGLLPWSPLAGGELAGVLRKTDTSRSDAARLSGHRREQVERYERFADDRGVDPAALGLAWLLHQPTVTAPIVGPRRMPHLHSALASLDIELTEEDLAELDRIWPGPGGPAPEAYAW
ncbi:MULTISPECIES: aldo/keto reductase [unclassified Microbacterium]|uniref:aldo/keto reductase n=1 Tax=unclassified Microbacterium TaxID=2609290 RepID=UPI000EAA85BB|nr:MULTISPECIES: aldo/keto reductase [unclassified Microbacterium]MBT2484403.1 aldo/keto reductase [Microbacterium sp. ISL-108]RKN67314.1 aldo/keto reductase [Microbacterium sp. CGR2]